MGFPRYRSRLVLPQRSSVIYFLCCFVVCAYTSSAAVQSCCTSSSSSSSVSVATHSELLSPAYLNMLIQPSLLHLMHRLLLLNNWGLTTRCDAPSFLPWRTIRWSSAAIQPLRCCYSNKAALCLSNRAQIIIITSTNGQRLVQSDDLHMVCKQQTSARHCLSLYLYLTIPREEFN